MSSVDDHAQELLARVENSDATAIGQAMTALEGNTAVGRSIRPALFSLGGQAHIVGITGPPGGGKSTLVGALAKAFRERDARVGIVAVDPSSARSGGAILGDRVRLADHALDESVFMRSMSSRGQLGGLSRATIDAVSVLDAAGWEIVMVETVGAGQADIEIIRIAHTTVVVSVPGLGDEIQAMKAGLLEEADIHVVNKCDLTGADRTTAELVSALTLAASNTNGWSVPVIQTSAIDGSGIDELADSVASHQDWQRSSGELEKRERRAAKAQIGSLATEILASGMDGSSWDRFESAVTAVVARDTDPLSATQALLGEIASKTAVRKRRE